MVKITRENCLFGDYTWYELSFIKQNYLFFPLQAIQKRIAGSVDFNRIWDEYKIGFGIPQEGYWIG